MKQKRKADVLSALLPCSRLNVNSPLVSGANDLADVHHAIIREGAPEPNRINHLM